MFKKYITGLFVTLVGFGIYDYHAGNTFFAGTYTVPMLLFVISLLVAIVAFVVGIFEKRVRVVAKYSLALCLGCLLELIIVDRITTYQADQSKVVGNDIIKAINESFLVEGEYKSTLEEYVPMYLPEIPLTKVGFSGTEFWYSRSDDGKDFYLSFDTRYGDILQYESGRGDWIWTD